MFFNCFPFQIMIPPKVVPQPMRITCRYVRGENLLYPPKLNDGEGNNGENGIKKSSFRPAVSGKTLAAKFFF